MSAEQHRNMLQDIAERAAANALASTAPVEDLAVSEHEAAPPESRPVTPDEEDAFGGYPSDIGGLGGIGNVYSRPVSPTGGFTGFNRVYMPTTHTFQETINELADKTSENTGVTAQNNELVLKAVALIEAQDSKLEEMKKLLEGLAKLVVTQDDVLRGIRASLNALQARPVTSSHVPAGTSRAVKGSAQVPSTPVASTPVAATSAPARPSANQSVLDKYQQELKNRAAKKTG